MESKHLNSNRKYYIDILRIISSFAVILIHTPSDFLTDGNIKSFSFDWYSLISLDIICHFAVPVFFMISGCLFLDSSYKLNIKKLYSKNILHLFTALIFWVLVYSTFKFVFGDYDNIFPVILDEGSYFHLWYIPVCIIIYILVPVIKKIAEDEKVLKYLLAFIIITQSILTTAMVIESNFTSYLSENYLSLIYNRFRISSDIFIYVGYFLFGYYLTKKELSKKSRIILYVSAIISTILTVVLTVQCAILDKHINTFMDYKCFNILILATAIFVLFKELFKEKSFSPKMCEILKYLSKISFGIYLVHLLVIKLLIRISPLPINFLSSIIISIATFIISVIISALLKKIPIINKYIV